MTQSSECDVSERVRRFHSDGFIVLEGLIESDLCDVVVEQMQAHIGFDRDYTKVVGTRLTDLWIMSEAVQALATHQRTSQIVESLLGSESFPFQTLNFPTGSEQAAHTDLIHFSTKPYGGMCGVWVALEDIADDAGPLFFYPSSHRLRPHVFESYGLNADGFGSQGPAYAQYEKLLKGRMEYLGFKKQLFLGRKGDVLIWHANLVHGGEPRVHPTKSRFSQVTHWFCRQREYLSPVNGWSIRSVNEIPKN